jgi:hypothetical protein
MTWWTDDRHLYYQQQALDAQQGRAERRRFLLWTEPVGVHDVDGVSMFCRTCGLGLDRITNGHVGSGHWTGRRLPAHDPLTLFRWWVRRLLWPSYECELCVGQDAWQGCYCAYYGSPRPSHGPSRARVIARGLATRWLGVEP